jgi:hypothetical protein
MWCPLSGSAVLSGRPASSPHLVSSVSGVQPVRCPAVRCPPVRWSAGCCPPRPSGRVRLIPPRAVAFGTRSRRRGDRHHRNGSRSLWLPRRRAARSTAQEAWGRATLPRSRWSVGVGGRTRAGLGAGGGRACPLSDQAGQAGVRSARAWRRRCGHGRRLQREVAAPAAWLPTRAGWATTVRGGRGACRPGGRAWKGRSGVSTGMACGPDAAQADGGRSRLAVGSAVTWGNGWWACQDLNLGPHPYQQNAGNRCAEGRFPWSRSTVEAKVTKENVSKWTIRR